jgi:hypothetical protein
MALGATSTAHVASTTAPRILFVGGFSRSGSTLLGRVLGECADAVCVGETRYLWHRGAIHNVRCGCGEPFHDCSFWGAVGRHAFGGWDRLDVERLAAIDAQVNRLRSLPLHRLGSLRPAFAATVADYASELARLYMAIAEVSGAGTLVETSKDPNFAWALTQMPGYDVRIVHLVRDSRAVACSWLAPKRLVSPIGKDAYMPTFAAHNTATRWSIANGAFNGLAARAPYFRCTYEAFVGDPAVCLRELDAFCSGSMVFPPAALDGDRVLLGEHHIFSGNPMSERTGWVQMRPDERWRGDLSKRQAATVTALSWPLLRRYGYPLSLAGAGDGAR